MYYQSTMARMPGLKFLLAISLFAVSIVGQEETGIIGAETEENDEFFDDSEGGVQVNGDGTSGSEFLSETVVPVHPNASCSGPRTAGELISHLMKGYDKLTRPGVAQALKTGYLSGALLETSPPDVARVQLHVLALNSVDQKRNEYQLTGWLRYSWKDPRLAYKTFSQGGCFPDDARIGFPERTTSAIWNPDFYIENAAEPPKQLGGAIWIKPDGEVIQSTQLEISLACKMRFEAFPFDTQQCYVKIGTYLEDSSSVILDFFEDREPVTLASETDPGIIAHGGSTEWTITDRAAVIEGSSAGSLTSNETSVTLRFSLKRNSRYYTAFVMAPSMMFVIIGWASFFISRAAAPARVAMSMICFLTNTNFLSVQLSQLPRLGNEAWLLKFLATSTYFTFYAVLEYCVCNYLFRIEARLNGARKRARELRRPPTVPQEGAPADDSKTGQSEEGVMVVTKEDIIATGFNRKVDLLILNPRNNRMYFKDEHVDVFSRYAYPTAYLVVFVSLWFDKQIS